MRQHSHRRRRSQTKWLKKTGRHEFVMMCREFPTSPGKICLLSRIRLFPLLMTFLALVFAEFRAKVGAILTFLSVFLDQQWLKNIF